MCLKRRTDGRAYYNANVDAAGASLDAAPLVHAALPAPHDSHLPSVSAQVGAALPPQTSEAGLRALPPSVQTAGVQILSDPAVPASSLSMRSAGALLGDIKAILQQPELDRLERLDEVRAAGPACSASCHCGWSA